MMKDDMSPLAYQAFMKSQLPNWTMSWNEER